MQLLRSLPFLFTLIFTGPLLQAAQANQQVVTKVKPIHHITQDYIFLIHPDHINIYPKTQDMLNVLSNDLPYITNNLAYVTFKLEAESTFEKDHADKKLVDTAYADAFKELDSRVLIPIITEASEEFLPICKKIFSENALDINDHLLIDQAVSRTDTLCFLKWLIDIGVEVNTTPPPFFYPPLSYAIDNIDIETVKLLVFAGADIHHHRNKDKFATAKSAPLIKAIFDEFYDIRTILRMNLPHIIILKVGNIAGISKEISEYLIGKRVKVQPKPRTTQN